MEILDVKRSFWSDAAKKGGILGVVLVIVMLLDWTFKLQMKAGWIVTLANFAAIAICVYKFGKQRSEKYGGNGYSYGQSMSYILAMMLFTGFISGVGSFIMQNYLAADYYKEVFDAALLSSGIDIDSDAMQQGINLSWSLMRNPIFMVLSGIFSMEIYGGFLGLFASVFLKRRPDLFTDGND